MVYIIVDCFCQLYVEHSETYSLYLGYGIPWL